MGVVAGAAAEAAAEVAADVAVEVPPGGTIPTSEVQMQPPKLLTHGRTLGDISQTLIWRIFSATWVARR